MKQLLIWRRGSALAALLVVALGAGVPVMVQAAPARQHHRAAAGSHDRKQLQAQLQEVDAKISSEHVRNVQLQAQVTQMEQQNADRQKQLQQRDEEIAALQKKLQAAGVPASATSPGP